MTRNDTVEEQSLGSELYMLRVESKMEKFVGVTWRVNSGRMPGWVPLLCSSTILLNIHFLFFFL